MRQYARTKVRFSKTLEPLGPVDRQADKEKIAAELQFLSTFRHVREPLMAAQDIAPLLPIDDDAVLTWVQQDIEARKHLSWPVAKALAFIDTFGPKP